MAERNCHDCFDSWLIVSAEARVQHPVSVQYGFRLLPKAAITLILLATIIGYFEYKGAQASQAKYEADKAIASIKAWEEETTRMRSEQAPFVRHCPAVQPEESAPVDSSS